MSSLQQGDTPMSLGPDDHFSVNYEDQCNFDMPQTGYGESDEDEDDKEGHGECYIVPSHGSNGTRGVIDHMKQSFVADIQDGASADPALHPMTANSLTVRYNPATDQYQRMFTSNRQNGRMFSDLESALDADQSTGNPICYDWSVEYTVRPRNTSPGTASLQHDVPTHVYFVGSGNPLLGDIERDIAARDQIRQDRLQRGVIATDRSGDETDRWYMNPIMVDGTHQMGTVPVVLVQWGTERRETVSALANASAEVTTCTVDLETDPEEANEDLDEILGSQPDMIADLGPTFQQQTDDANLRIAVLQEGGGASLLEQVEDVFIGTSTAEALIVEVAKVGSTNSILERRFRSPVLYHNSTRGTGAGAETVPGQHGLEMICRARMSTESRGDIEKLD